jgi:pantetheine-phosphate adenylyltransferase
MRTAIYPASFDPIHYGHIDIAMRAARLFDELIVAVYDRPNKRLLFTAQERLALVEKSLQHIPNIRFAIYSGLTVDYARRVGGIALANRRLAPSLEIVNLIAGEAYVHLSSSTVREIASLGGDVSTMVPLHVQQALRNRFAELNENGDDPVYMVSITD